jgi:hypothetical protein
MQDSNLQNYDFNEINGKSNSSISKNRLIITLNFAFLLQNIETINSAKKIILLSLQIAFFSF